jgi:TRAP-type C4-dicarboxylate transport system permease small subunit
MNAMRIAGIILVVLGIAGFFTGGFNYTKNETKAQLGPLKLQVQEQDSVNIPQWLSLGAMVIGGVLLVMGFKR